MSAPAVTEFERSLEEFLPAGARERLAGAPRGERPALLAEVAEIPLEKTIDWIAERSGLPILRDPMPDDGTLNLFPPRLYHEFRIMPVDNPEPGANGDGILRLATAWPPDEIVRDWIAAFTPRPVAWLLAPAERIAALIVERFGVGSGSLDEAPDADGPTTPEIEIDADEEAAVVRFVTDVVRQAVVDEATDIHFEPQEDQLRIRYRVDGLLVPVPVPENLRRYQDAIISRLKIMARLNISERRLPQDGRIAFKSGDTPLDIRVSTIPTIYAESVSLRLLNQKKRAFTMDSLGLTADEQAQIRNVIGTPHGIILVTGPTGSGKSTSLNAFLRDINTADRRIVTIEDPIEYELPGVNQMQIRPEIGLRFADALRHVLRQDPDVIMVGEIRDRETADIAIRSSLTGHLVFSTLHTNDAPGALTRLVDMGLEPYLVASSIEMVIAQRLVRRLCPHCVAPQPVEPATLRANLGVLGLDLSIADGIETLPGAKGCDQCRRTGYRGRVGIFEILRLNDETHDLLLKNESARTLARGARRHGMRTLQESGWRQVQRGLTSLEEVVRATTAGV